MERNRPVSVADGREGNGQVVRDGERVQVVIAKRDSHSLKYSLIKRDGLLVEAGILISHRQVIERFDGVGMILTQHGLSLREG